ncbi:MAG: amidohydrolase family protein, partial [Eubacteriales bacterium]|nr:amidohydrolase family protein [Eubacteriales bacterium]
PHYFSLTEDACDNFNTLAKVNPPLRTAADVDAVIEGISDGTIDFIVTDHAPHHIDEKNVEFELAANGITGFETAFSLAYTYLVKSGHISLGKLVSLMSLNPSGFFGLNKGTLEPGRQADVTVVDLSAEYRVDISSFRSKAVNSPFNGFPLSGLVRYTIVGGKTVVREGVLL